MDRAFCLQNMRFLGLLAALWAQQRPWQIGIIAGLNLPAYRSTQKVAQASVLPGFSGGIGGRYALTSRFSVMSGIFFSQRNSAYTYEESTIDDTAVGNFRDTFITHLQQRGRLEIGHLELPIFVMWDFLRGENYANYLYLGAQVGYRLFGRNYGNLQVSLEGLDFLPLFGFPPQTRVIVASGPIPPESVLIRPWDAGLCVGGGNRFQMGQRWMSFEVRYFHGLANLFQEPRASRLYNGSISFMMGYWL